MAYTPKTWVCGETITADGLNNIEEGIQDALECCGSGGDCGYECVQSRETAFEGQLTTEKEESEDAIASVVFMPISPISGESILVTINNSEYELPRVTTQFATIYGEVDQRSEPVFTTYPCVIAIMNIESDDITMLATPTAGTYQVKIESFDMEIDSITPCFKKAVEEISGNGTFLITASATLGEATQKSNGSVLVINRSYSEITLDKSYEEIEEAFSNGKNCIMKLNDNTVLQLNRVGFSKTWGEHAFDFNATCLTETQVAQTNTIEYSLTTTKIVVDNEQLSGHQTEFLPYFSQN